MNNIIRGIWAHSPFLLDTAGSILIAALMAFTLWHFELTPPLDPTKNLASGVAGLAGLVATAEVFACTAMYSSQSARLQQIRNDHVRTLARNWMTCLAGAVGSATFSLLSLFVIDEYSDWGLSLVIGCLAMTILGFYRALHWLRFTLFHEAVDKRKQEVPLYEGLDSSPSTMKRR